MLVLFVIGLAVAFVNLGTWQLDRLAQRKERNASTRTNEQAPVRPYQEIFGRPILDADQWQRVEARGTFDAEHQIIVRYRTAGDIDGYEVVTPLRTASGAVLVDRGLVPVTSGAQIPTLAPPPPSGDVVVVGHVRRSEKGRAAATTPVNGHVRLVNAAAIAATLPYPVADGYIGLLSVQPAQQGDLKPIPVPELSNGPHFWYAMQWFMFIGIGAAGIVVLVRGDLRERREQATRDARPRGQDDVPRSPASAPDRSAAR